MTTPDPENPVLFGTQRDYAWNAWQSAFDAGKLLPDSAKFHAWWNDFGVTVQWKSVHEMMQAAWGKGVQDRNEQCTAGFDAWWQHVLADAQPVDTHS
jgi:hypothetical protein